jgi:hypothetical protein
LLGSGNAGVSSRTQTNTVLEPLKMLISIQFSRSDKRKEFARQSNESVVLSRRLEARDQSENQNKYSERFVIKKEFNV